MILVKKFNLVSALNRSNFQCFQNNQEKKQKFKKKMGFFYIKSVFY